ncbi:hypothetical protein IB644_02425 [Allofrancisella guangzhouensis]|uniref:hypothetical protein n=1 Tax=Allofrancisella guangzhouensis TaxID=594679 RepID=UPI001905E62F|nr:hypothetical protein [Allofrancisella guangzhouensis]MBK2045416.1 hypothetical protein [Allofrancisella guangzhouensis]
MAHRHLTLRYRLLPSGIHCIFSLCFIFFIFTLFSFMWYTRVSRINLYTKCIPICTRCK